MRRVKVASAVLLAAIAGTVAPVRAEPARDASPRAWHAGVNLRPELGVHPLRLDGGVRFGRVDTFVVLDPWWWTDGVSDIDVAGEWRPGDTYSFLGGWRTSTVELDRDAQHQERALFAVGALLPAVLGGGVRPHVGLELSVLVAKHGGGLPTDGFPLDRTALGHLTAGAFLRLDYGRAL